MANNFIKSRGTDEDMVFEEGWEGTNIVGATACTSKVVAVREHDAWPFGGLWDC